MKNILLHSLYRTENPKYAHYGSDGAGRDTYILSMNGGLLRDEPKSPPYYKTAGTAMFSRKQHSSPSPKKEASCFKYTSDGSGRDSYILYNSGGLHADYFPGKKTFESSLRFHEKRPSNKRNKDLYDYQNWQSPERTQQLRSAMYSQKMLTSRLSTPRYYELDIKKNTLSPRDTRLDEDDIFPEKGSILCNKESTLLSPIKKNLKNPNFPQGLLKSSSMANLSRTTAMGAQLKPMASQKKIVVFTDKLQPTAPNGLTKRGIKVNTVEDPNKVRIKASTTSYDQEKLRNMLKDMKGGTAPKFSVKRNNVMPN